MRIHSALLFFAVCRFAPLVSADPLQEIELTDGSLIRAAVVSMSHGVYQVRSETLGEIEIPAPRIKAIRSLAAQGGAQSNREPEGMFPSSTAEPPAPPADLPMKDLQQTLMQDPVAMEKILSLQDDPLVQSILSDEETMRAIQASDLEPLLGDPKIRALMEHPAVRALLSRTPGR